MKKKFKKRKRTKDISLKIDDTLKNKKIKTMIEFDFNECNSIKSIAIKRNTTDDVTLRFIQGKMLMFAKVSLKSFIYDMNHIFCLLT